MGLELLKNPRERIDVDCTNIPFSYGPNTVFIFEFLSFGRLWKAQHPSNVVPSRISDCLSDLFGCAFPEARLHAAT